MKLLHVSQTFVTVAIKCCWSLEVNTTKSVLERIEILESEVKSLINQGTTTEDNRQIEPITEHILDLQRKLHMLQRVRQRFRSYTEPILNNTATTDSSNSRITPIDKYMITPIANSQETKRLETRETTEVIKSELLATTEKMPMESELAYRRDMSDREKKRYNSRKKLLLANCHILFTPLWLGTQVNKLFYPIVTEKDYMLSRLVNILHLNVTGFTYDDRVGMLRQVSLMRLRMFLWKPRAIMILMNTLILGTNQHNFDTLRTGVRNLFTKWKIDYSNTKMLLKHSQIFRPPCMNFELPGSTLSPTRITVQTFGIRTTKSCSSTNPDVIRTGNNNEDDAYNQQFQDVEDIFAAVETGLLSERRSFNGSRVDYTDDLLNK